MQGSTFWHLSSSSLMAKSACDRAATSASRKSIGTASLKTKATPRQPGPSYFTRPRSRSRETNFGGAGHGQDLLG